MTADIDEMRILLEKLNNLSDSDEVTQSVSTPTRKIESMKTVSSSNSDIDAMRNILERFNAVVDETSQQLHEEAINTPQINEALQTTKTKTGAVVGKWEVKTVLKESSDRKTKTFNIVNPETKQPVFEDLCLYEAAYSIVKLFNRGHTAESTRVKEVLNLEETYFRNRQDAMRFKQRYIQAKNSNNQQGLGIFSTRYQTARAHALAAHDQIKSLLESIR